MKTFSLLLSVLALLGLLEYTARRIFPSLPHETLVPRLISAQSFAQLTQWDEKTKSYLFRQNAIKSEVLIGPQKVSLDLQDKNGHLVRAATTNASKVCQNEIWFFGDLQFLGLGKNFEDTLAFVNRPDSCGINFSILKSTTWNQQRYFKEAFQRAQKKPTTVVFSINWDNDVHEHAELFNLTFQRPRYRDPNSSAHLSNSFEKFNPERYLTQNSYAYRFLSQWILKRFYAHHGMSHIEFAGHTPASPAHTGDLPWLHVKRFIDDLQPFPHEKYNAKFIYLSIPSAQTVKALKAQPGHFEAFRRIPDFLATALSSRTTHFLNILPLCRPPEISCFSQTDRNLSTTGHEIARHELARILFRTSADREALSTHSF